MTAEVPRDASRMSAQKIHRSGERDLLEYCNKHTIHALTCQYNKYCSFSVKRSYVYVWGN